jgi:hypothetical protein
VEVVRRECDLRCELLDQAVAAAHSASDVVDALVGSFEHFLGEGPGTFAMFYEMLTLAQHFGLVAQHLELRRLAEH